MSTTPDDPRAAALAGMRAAIECCRIQHTGMAQGAELAGEAALRSQAVAAAALEAARRDADRAGLDLDGALIAITLRAASLASAAIDGMTIPKFLDLLEAETRGWRPPDQE